MVDDTLEKIAAEIARPSKSSEPIPTDMPLLYSGLNSITGVRLYMWLQSEYEYEEEMTHLLDEETHANVLAEAIAAEITKLSKSSEAVPKDMPLLYSGLNSITMVRLHMWLQAEHEYEEEMSHLFDEEGAEDDNTESSTDTVVEDGASEVHVLEKDPEFTTDNSIVVEAAPELSVQVSNEPAHHSAVNDDVPNIYIVSPEDDETSDSADEDAFSQILIVNDSNSDYEFEEEIDNEPEIIMCYNKPKSPLPNMRSPMRCDFDIPESPALDNSSFSFLFSSWITPLKAWETRRSLLDSVLSMLAV